MMTQTGSVSNSSLPVNSLSSAMSNTESAFNTPSSTAFICNVTTSALPSNISCHRGASGSAVIGEQGQPDKIIIPKIVHFVWEGKNIPEKHLFNILNFKRINPDFEVKIWTTRPASINCTLDKMLNGENAEYRYLAFNFSDKSDGGRFLQTTDPRVLFSGLGPGVYAGWARETSGCFNNQAAASDITRLAALYQFGGTYFDVDVYMTGKFDCPIYDPADSRTSGILTYGNPIITAIKHSPSLAAALQTINDNYQCTPRSASDYFYSFNAMFSSDKRYFEGADIWDIKRTSKSGRIQGSMNMTGIDVLKEGWWPEANSIGCGNMVFGHRSDDSIQPTKFSLSEQHKTLTEQMNKKGLDQKQKELDLYLSRSSDWREKNNDCMVFTDDGVTREERLKSLNDPLSRGWRKDVDAYAESYKHISKLKARRSSS